MDRQVSSRQLAFKTQFFDSLARHRAKLLLAAIFGLSCAQAGAVDHLHPSIKFIHPREGEVVSDYPISIQVDVHDFKLRPPVEYWGNVMRKDEFTGHVHYMLDDSPIYATSKTAVMLVSSGKPLPPGKHILRAELVNINHAPLKDRVFSEVTIMCRRTDAQGKPSGNGDAILDRAGKLELQQIDFQLKQIEQQLQQIKGHS